VGRSASPCGSLTRWLPDTLRRRRLSSATSTTATPNTAVGDCYGVDIAAVLARMSFRVAICNNNAADQKKKNS
jgi:hypothetical protein